VKQITEEQAFAAALQGGNFDLVITDSHLRWTDGLSVLRAVKARHPGVPVIMFTGTGNEELAVEAMQAGLDDYIRKTTRSRARLLPEARTPDAPGRRYGDSGLGDQDRVADPDRRTCH